MADENEDKLLRSIELEQRKKTEESYRAYRNAGIAISTIFVGFVTGVAYKFFTATAYNHNLKSLVIVITALLVLSTFTYQVVLYGGFRFVALGHYYFLRAIVQRMGKAAQSELNASLESSTVFSSNSNNWFGAADKVFIVLCGATLGFMAIVGMIYFRVENIPLLLIAFAIPVTTALCAAFYLRT